MYPKILRVLLQCRCLSFLELFPIHSITCVLLNSHMFGVGRFLIACFFLLNERFMCTGEIPKV